MPSRTSDTLEFRLAPLMRVPCPPIGSLRHRSDFLNRNQDRIPIRPEADPPSAEHVGVILDAEVRIFAVLVGTPYCVRALRYVDVACPLLESVTTMRTLKADVAIGSVADRFDGAALTIQNPYLNHVPCLDVFRFHRGDYYEIFRFVNRVP